MKLEENADESLLELQNVTRVIGDSVLTTLVDNVDLTINKGVFASVTGPSGSGKSSLLYLLGLLDAPTSGEIILRGHHVNDLDEPGRAQLRLSTIGFVFQFHFLLPEFTALANVTLPMRALNELGRDEMNARASELLISLGLEKHMHKYPHQLSGGERQRVAIARALANQPHLLLADEPTGNLDSVSGAQVIDIFRKLAEEAGRSIIMVTHDLDLASQTDRQIRMLDGRIV